MADLLFKCSNCSTPLAVEDDCVGQTIECPGCHGQVSIPQPGTFFRCTNLPCRVELTTPASMVGQEIDCPSCETRQTVPLKRDLRIKRSKPVPTPAEPSPEQGGRLCPACGKAVAPAAIVCMNCGINLLTGNKHGKAQSSTPHLPNGRTTSPSRNPILSPGTIFLILLVVGVWGYQGWWKPAKARDDAYASAFRVAEKGQPTPEVLAALTAVMNQYPNDGRAARAASILGDLRSEQLRQSGTLAASINEAERAFSADAATATTERDVLDKALQATPFATNRNAAATLINRMAGELNRLKAQAEDNQRAEGRKQSEMQIRLNAQLGTAAGDGEVSAVERLISQGASLDAEPAPILAAYNNGKIDMVLYLLSKGADPKPVVQRAARYKGDLGSLQTLVAKGASLKECDALDTFWHNDKDVWWCNFKLLQFLIANGADFTRHDKNGESVLHRLARTFRGTGVLDGIKVGGEQDVLSLAETLLAKGCDPNEWAWGKTPALVSIIDGDLVPRDTGYETLNLPLTPFDYAVAIGDMRLIRLFAAHGASINPPPTTTTSLAPSSRLPKRQRQHKQAEPDAAQAFVFTNPTPLMIACRLRTHCTDYVPCDQGVPDKNRIVARIRPEVSSILVAETLLEMGADPKCCCWGGRTALHEAATLGPLRLCQKLVAAGAAVNAVDDAGVTPLHGAAQKGLSEVVDFLLTKGANPNLADVAGRTALHAAVESMDWHCVSLLIKGGADVNAADAGGNTPLMVAISKRPDPYSPLIGGFIQAGARIDQKTADGRTVIDILLANSDRGMRKVGYLLQEGKTSEYLALVKTEADRLEKVRLEKERKEAWEAGNCRRCNGSGKIWMGRLMTPAPRGSEAFGASYVDIEGRRDLGGTSLPCPDCHGSGRQQK